jgi:hypothetical protein
MAILRAVMAVTRGVRLRILRLVGMDRVTAVRPLSTARATAEATAAMEPATGPRNAVVAQLTAEPAHTAEMVPVTASKIGQTAQAIAPPSVGTVAVMAMKAAPAAHLTAEPAHTAATASVTTARPAVVAPAIAASARHTVAMAQSPQENSAMMAIRRVVMAVTRRAKLRILRHVGMATATGMSRPRTA